MWGSPPRVRGKPYRRCSRVDEARITPACAGKTGEGVRHRPGQEDHPRVCGENLHRSRHGCARGGSPPRVRGKLPFLLQGLYGARITPACAGKTTGCATRSSRWRDHPRVCGENSSRTNPLRELSGSPPRVRGKRWQALQDPAPRGITPACAGKTGCKRARGALREDHPRVCGENSRTPGAYQRGEGSPPRVRGKHPYRSRIFSMGGITPACAGKTT